MQGGGRFRGIDPIVPYVEADVIDSLKAFYGLEDGCPVPEALVRGWLCFGWVEARAGQEKVRWEATQDCPCACVLTIPPCPALLSPQIARSTDPRPKKLYYVGPAVKLLLRMDYREQLKVIGAGVKALERQDSKVSSGLEGGRVGGPVGGPVHVQAACMSLHACRRMHVAR